MVEFGVLKISLNYAIYGFVKTLSHYKILNLIVFLCIDRVSEVASFS